MIGRVSEGDTWVCVHRLKVLIEVDSIVHASGSESRLRLSVSGNNWNRSISEYPDEGFVIRERNDGEGRRG